jgi:hypothetical protein
MSVVEIKAPQAIERTVEVMIQECHFMESGVRVILTGGLEKVISLDDFRTILNSAIGQVESTILDGFNTPSNLFYFAKSASALQLSCYYKGGIRPVNYNGTVRDFLMPNIIISHQLSRESDKVWLIGDSKYFCTDVGISKLPKTFINGVDGSKRIFLLPMSEGRMCYGENVMVSKFTENNLRGLDWYYEYLFQSPFNADLGIKSLSEDYRVNVSTWYEELASLAKMKDAVFPYHKLRGHEVPE